MQKMILPLLALVYFCLVATASAEVKEFGPDFYPYTIDLPEGWKAEALKPGSMMFASPDNMGGVFVIIAKDESLSSKAMEEAVPEIVKGQGYDSFKKTGQDAYVLVGKQDGVDLVTHMVLKGKILINVVLKGDLELAKPVAESINFKNN